MGSVTMPNHAPRANSTIDETTKGMANLRSLSLRPGTMKAHSSNSRIGSARTMPVNVTILILVVNGSSGVV